MAWALTDTIKQYAVPITYGAHILAAAFIWGGNALSSEIPIEIAGYNAKRIWWVFILLLALSLFIFHKTTKGSEAKQKTIDDLKRDNELLKRDVQKRASKNFNHVEDLPPLGDFDFK